MLTNRSMNLFQYPGNLTHLVLRDEPAGVVRVFVDELLGFVWAREEEDSSVARLQERPS